VLCLKSTLRRAVLAAALLVACATSPLGRRQIIIFPEGEMDAMGAAAFQTLKTQMPASRDLALQRYVECVAGAVSAEIDPDQGPVRWEVTVFDEDSANAFALPGRKIGVHRGMFEIAQSQDQLATVLGHEMAHVLARHANERVSTAYATQTGLELLSLLAGASSPAQRELMAWLGVGAQVGILLPFGRAQEREADLLGLDLMARAGFDPRESQQLWENMSRGRSAGPPEFLSTHPSHDRRMRDLGERIPTVMSLYERAGAAGRRPACSRSTALLSGSAAALSPRRRE
jgi:predicted Zn-dependent protease